MQSTQPEVAKPSLLFWLVVLAVVCRDLIADILTPH